MKTLESLHMFITASQPRADHRRGATLIVTRFFNSLAAHALAPLCAAGSLRHFSIILLLRAIALHKHNTFK